MFGTPRHPDESGVGAPRTGEDVTQADRPRPAEVAGHPADDAIARTSTSTTGHVDDVPVHPSGKPTIGGSTTEAGTTGKGGGETKADAPT